MTKRPEACTCVGFNHGQSAYPYSRQTPERLPMSEHPDEFADDTPNISRADAARLHLRFDWMLIMCLTQQQERTGRPEEKAENLDGSTESESGSAEELHSVDQDDGVMSASLFSGTFSIATPDTEEETAESEIELALSRGRGHRN
ncbi:hypothetical protein LTR01_005429 [Friedmanniomyces endolithicus]|nr:hypothetical protein LTR01_005429 [Friedmanniomyces endolithicus]KAK0831544.1 hypothetical protein LTR73_002927 [Friedmanniomyces endolithicus]